ncbi:MAG TPA: DMT family transporter [Thermoleophilaceae bacterium]|nr:DMT family transporter [Thermoleophilaceae bacterium]
MGKLAAILATFAAGALVAAQPPANNELSKHVGGIAAAFTSTVISATVLGAILVAGGHAGRLSGLRHVRPEHLLGGLGGAAIVWVSLITVRTLGAGGVVAATVCGQLTVAALLDRLGVLGLERVGLTPLRLLGMALMVAGTFALTSR